ESEFTAPWSLFAVGAAGIVVGLATFGHRVIATVGLSITELTPSRGFAAELATAGTVVAASIGGIPVSTTHTLVGAIVGVGIARSVGAINLTTVRSVLASWVITAPISGLLS